MVPFVHLLTTGFGHKADVMKASPNVRFWARNADIASPSRASCHHGRRQQRTAPTTTTAGNAAASITATSVTTTDPAGVSVETAGSRYIAPPERASPPYRASRASAQAATRRDLSDHRAHADQASRVVGSPKRSPNRYLAAVDQR